MIAIRRLKKAYGEHVLFENWNLSIAAGEYVTLSGPSGCGKTTLLHMIGRLEKPDEGEILVDGVAVSAGRGLLAYYGGVVGFVFQNFALVPEKNIRQNLHMVQKSYRSGLSVEEAMARVGLDGRENERIYTLSGGEQQRVALARLMMKRCKLILADEPTGSLDPQNAERVMSILEELYAEGKTLVVVTHNEDIWKRGTRRLTIHTRDTAEAYGEESGG